MRTMRDNTGHDVPVKYVGKYDRLRDERTKRVLARFRKARGVLEAVVRDSLADIAAIQAARDTPVAEKGNFSVTSFDGLRLHGRFLPLENAKGTILLFHGFLAYFRAFIALFK